MPLIFLPSPSNLSRAAVAASNCLADSVNNASSSNSRVEGPAVAAVVDGDDDDVVADAFVVVVAEQSS